MKEKLCIYICNSLVPEVAHLLQAGDYPDVELKSFAANCTSKPMNEEELLALVGKQVNEYNKIIVILSTCFRKAKTNLQSIKNIEIVQLEQCFEILFSLPSIYHFIKQGNYLVTNGWLRNYKQHVREWGFSPQTAKNYFGESLKKVILLDTALPGDYQANLEALSEYMGLPYEVFPIGSSHLQKSLDALIFNWRSEKERRSLNDSISKFSRLTSEHLLIFNHLKELVNVSDPKAIVDKIGFLCDLLFAPDQLIFEGFNNDGIYEKKAIKAGKTARNPDHSFSIAFEFDREILGKLAVDNVKFPEFMQQYVSMASVIGQMGGLAISNAERFTDLERAKQKIQESAAHFKSLMKQSPSVIEIYDLEGYQRSVNRAYEKLWGFPASQTVGKFNLFTSDEVKSTGLIDYIERAYKGKPVQVPVYKFDPSGENEAHGLGRVRWLSTRMYPLKDQNKKVKSIVITHEDVTEQKIAEQKLAESNQKFKILSRSATEMLQLESLDDIYNYCIQTLYTQYPNAVILFLKVDPLKQTTKLIGMKGVSEKIINSAISLAGFNFLNSEFKLVPEFIEFYRKEKLYFFEHGLAEFVSMQFPETAAKAIEKILDIKQICTIGVNKDNSLFATIHFFNRSTIPITDNEFIESFVKQAAIIIDRKLAEQEVLKSEERFRSIFEEAPIGIALINSLNGKIIELNDKFASIAGRTHNEIKNIDWMQINHPDDVQEDLDNMTQLNAGLIKGFNMHKRYVRPDGNIVWINLTIAPVGSTPGGDPLHLRMIEDISEIKETNELILKKNDELNQLNATKDKFFSIISHDLRSPLSSIINLSELLSDELYNFSSEELKTFAQSINQTADSTYRLLQNLLEWSRLQRGNIPFIPVQIDIANFLDSCDHSIIEKAKNKHIKLDMLFPVGLKVRADENMLRSIMRNLLSNAIKFTRSDGKIQIKIEEKEAGEILFAITDNGIGIPSDLIHKLFKVAENVSRPGTDKEKSSGLGLILCKEFVEMHGGKIWVESEEGYGSTFYFTIAVST